MSQQAMTDDGRPAFRFEYRRSPDQDRPENAPARHPVVVVGAGPVGLTLALELARRGVGVVLLDDSDRIGEGSRAICFSKRTLEIWDRLGVGARMIAKGVEWQKGRVFQRGGEIYQFDLLPEGGHKMPAFINLQQYYAEAYLVDQAGRQPLVEIRWRNRVSGIDRRQDGAAVTIDTPEGSYRLACDWLVCCDGARSPCRALLGIDFAGEMFDDQFLIADVRMTAPFPTERWFWFDPPFHAGQSALLHKQPDDVWRIDLQLSPDADSEEERRPEVVKPRIARMLGHHDFELEWVSVYRFQCRRIERFVHDRIVFAGDAAHQVSPFGARGANSGVEDAENLAWKLAAVHAGEAPVGLIQTYDRERGQAADENIAHSTRSTDFIAPRTSAERRYRDAALALAAACDPAKRFVNSGRLSTPTVYRSELSTPDKEPFAGSAAPGAVLPDAPVLEVGAAGRRHEGWLLDRLGVGFTLIHEPSGGGRAVALEGLPVGVDVLSIGTDVEDRDGLVRSRLDLTPGALYLVRPDGHVAARMRSPDPRRIRAAILRALCRGEADA